MIKSDSTRNLHWCLRCTLACWGVLLCTAAAFLTMLPPKQETIERVTPGLETKTVIASPDVTHLTAVVFVSGVVVMLYAANGIRFTRIVAGEYTADSDDPKTLAKKYQNSGQSASPVSVNVPETDAPQPTELPKGIISSPLGESVAVYSLQDIPTTVVRDALSNWPSNIPLPANIDTFEFGTRQTGKGNHPWTLKFKGSPPVLVAYGGKGKTGATVTGGS